MKVDPLRVLNRALVVGTAAVLLVVVAGQAAASDSTLVSHWKLDEASGTTTVDVASGGQGVLHNGAAFVAGKVGNAVAFDGLDDFVSGDASVDTSADFTVAAWVNISNKDCDLGTTDQCKLTAVSLDGDRTSAFRLGHLVDDDQHQSGAWYFEQPESDADNAQITQAASSIRRSEVDTWVHLVGVHAAATRKVWLYVNGLRVGDGTINTPWRASGELRIGGGKVDGAAGEHWPGKVDDVQIYSRALDHQQVSALYRSSTG